LAQQPAPKPPPEGIDGEIGRRIRLLREARRLSLAEVALRIGKSVGFVSQVERGLSSLAIREVVRIAEILEVDFLSLVSPGGVEGEASPVRRAAETAPKPFHASGITKRPLAPANPGALQLFVMSLEPGASTGTELYHHEGEEAGVVTEGSIHLTVGAETYALAEGDSFRFASSIPHGFANAAVGRSVVLWVNVKR
jgi:transcriptional regulator with XRE-family HTH domain